jgi:uncharacterized protein DUF5648
MRGKQERQNMFKPIMKIATAVALGLGLHSMAYCQSKWEFGEIFSTPDGAVQFIVLAFNGYTAELPALAGQTLVASDGKTEQTFTFASNVTHYFSDHGFDTGPCNGFMQDGCWSYVLVATQKFADLHLVKPDFVVPNGFLSLSNGSVRLGVSESRYDALPADGENARWWDTGQVLEAVATNNAGESYVFMPAGINPIVEYYNGLDDYFLTAYPAEITFLDSGFYRDWQRTGYTLPAWTSPFSVDAPPPPNLTSVCRLWLGNSHFYSISESECANVAQSPGSFLESQAAFFATLPNADTGACPEDQTRVYRLWNPRGSAHRYTTQAVVRDEMLTRGWIAEGYGPNSVAMCVGGNN